MSACTSLRSGAADCFADMADSSTKMKNAKEHTARSAAAKVRCASPSLQHLLQRWGKNDLTAPGDDERATATTKKPPAADRGGNNVRTMENLLSCPGL